MSVPPETHGLSVAAGGGEKDEEMSHCSLMGTGQKRHIELVPVVHWPYSPNLLQATAGNYGENMDFWWHLPCLPGESIVSYLYSHHKVHMSVRLY
jgi:hypothetical protein